MVTTSMELPLPHRANFGIVRGIIALAKLLGSIGGFRRLSR